MEYDREEQRRRREFDEAMAQQKKLEAKLAELKRTARTAKSRLLSSTTKSETWHRMTLGAADREAGYAGEMASARVWLRSLPTHDYVRTLAPFAETMPDATNLAVEVAAVKANLADWTVKGDALILARARRAYAADSVSFAAWQREHPDHETWRKKVPTRPQGFLIARIAAAFGVEAPGKMNRGEAHDWIAGHGGNPRLAVEPEPVPTPPAPTTTGMPVPTTPVPAAAEKSAPVTITPAPVRAAFDQRDGWDHATRRDEEGS